MVSGCGHHSFDGNICRKLRLCYLKCPELLDSINIPISAAVVSVWLGGFDRGFCLDLDLVGITKYECAPGYNS
jgi:hypothetical protein